MSKPTIKQRLEEMKAQMQRQSVVVEQAKANLNAFAGAVQILQELLAEETASAPAAE